MNTLASLDELLRRNYHTSYYQHGPLSELVLDPDREGIKSFLPVKRKLPEFLRPDMDNLGW